MNLITRLWRRFRRPAPALPFRPFHPARLKEGPALHLLGQEESLPVRAVMEILERAIMQELNDLTGQTGDRLLKASGRLSGLMDLYDSLEQAVRTGGRGA